MLPGELIGERYRIRCLLGRGGMASVYLTQDTQADQKLVAVKVMHLDFDADTDLLQRFEREVHVMRKVNHPNVATFYGFGVHKQLVYLAMEYVPGCSLERFLGQGNRLSSAEIVVLSLGICDGLSAIHKHGIIHRDIKPANILVTTNGMVKIIDLGAAYESTSTITKPRQRIGSLSYLAPEVWAGKAMSARVDLYSLGVVLYEMITGKPPFDSDNPLLVMRMHQEQRIVPPEAVVKGVPAWLNSLVVSLLDKDPANRPTSAEEVAQYLVNHAVNEFESLLTEGLAGKPITTAARLAEGEVTSLAKSGKAQPANVGQIRSRTYIFQVKATDSPGKQSKNAGRGRLLLSIPLPQSRVLVFEIEKPSLDFLFLGIFLASLYYLNGTPFLTQLLQGFDPELILLIFKAIVLFVLYQLTQIIKTSGSVKNPVTALSCLYTIAAILPWFFI